MKKRDRAIRAIFNKAIDYHLSLSPEEQQENYINLTETVFKYFNKQLESMNVDWDEVFEYIKNPDNKWMEVAADVTERIHPNCVKGALLNLGFQSMLVTNFRRGKHSEKIGASVPWTILFDPTSACNKNCIGCWASEYDKQTNLSYEEMDRIVSECKELDIYFFMMTGGEPLIRKEDILTLAKAHDECYFSIFTNGSLIDDDFAQKVQDLGNLSFSLSIEGFEDVNDSRRGEGSFQEIMDTMDILKKYGIPFGTSQCYTSKNYKSITSDEFMDLLVEKGALYAWFFHYMPVGKNAGPELMPNPDQREYIYRRIREIRSGYGGKKIFCMDFQNDASATKGCIAGGKNYFHINSNGDVEPCVFIHYSDTNIKDYSIKEILQSPLFAAYQSEQPFNDNMLKPCPMLENPEILSRIVAKTSAKNTDVIEPEAPEELCKKTKPYAEAWDKRAEELWSEFKK